MNEMTLKSKLCELVRQLAIIETKCDAAVKRRNVATQEYQAADAAMQDAWITLNDARETIKVFKTFMDKS